MGKAMTFFILTESYEDVLADLKMTTGCKGVNGIDFKFYDDLRKLEVALFGESVKRHQNRYAHLPTFTA